MDASETEQTRDDCRLGDNPDGPTGNNRNKSKNVSIVVMINIVTDVCVLLKGKDATNVLNMTIFPKCVDL